MFGFGIAEQTRTFVLAFGFGFLLGIVYDIIRVVRMLFADSKKLVAVQDIIFSLTASFALFNFFLVVNKGEFRGYLFFSIALGFFLYRFSFGSFVVFFFNKIIGMLRSFFKIILFPFRIIYRPLKRFFIYLLKKIRKFKLFLNLHLKNIGKVLYNKFEIESLHRKIRKNWNEENTDAEKI